MNGAWNKCFLFSFFFLRFYLFIWQREIPGDRGRQRQREREGSRLPAEQRAWCGTWSQDPEIMTWAEGSGLTHWATQAPPSCLFFKIRWYLIVLNYLPNRGAPGWLSGLSQCLRLKSWSQGPGIKSRIGLSAQQGACFPPLSACLSAYLWSLSNNILTGKH